MAVYILNFLSLPIYNLLVKDRKKLVMIVTAQLFLILALRDPTLGVDLPNYSSGYEFISSLGFVDMLSRLRIISTAELVYPYAYESGYVVLNWILGKLGVSFHAFLIMHAAFCMTAIGLFIYRYSKAPWLSFSMVLALSYFEYSFGILRQLIAICILLYAVPLIEKKKPIRFLLLVVLAFFFHRTAIVFAVLYLARYIRVTRIVYIVNAVLWVLLIALTPLLFNHVIVRILALLGKTSYSTISFEWNNMTTMLLAIAVAAFLTLDFAALRGSRRSSILCWGFLLAMPFQIFGMANQVLGRMVMYFLIFMAILVPNILVSYRKNRVLAEIGKYGLWAFMFVFMVYQFYDSPITPYLSVF